MDNCDTGCIVCFFVVGLFYFRLVVFEYEHVLMCVVLRLRTHADNYELAILFYLLITFCECAGLFFVGFFYFLLYFISYISLVHSFILNIILSQ